MLDIGWDEMLMIAVMAIIFIGPKELPTVVRAASRFINRLRGFARDFVQGMNQIAEEAEISKVQTEMGRMRADIQRSLDAGAEIPDALLDKAYEQMRLEELEGARKKARQGNLKSNKESVPRKISATSSKKTFAKKPAVAKKAATPAKAKTAASKKSASKAKKSPAAKSAKPTATKGKTS